MPEQSDKLTQFWNELKRRKVIRVMAMYAASAFIILEAVDIIFPRMGLPDWTVTLVIFLLIIGFIFSIIISWIFDVTSEGLKKTEPVKVAKVPTAKTSKRKLELSDLIIVVLVVVVCILIYPKIFNGDKFGDIRDEDGRISAVVLPFQNLSGDTLYDGFELGLQDLIINKLSNSDELSVRHIQTMYDFMNNTEQLSYASITPSYASDVAQKLDANTVIFGSLNSSGDKIRIIANLMNSKNKEIYRSFPIEGYFKDNIFQLADSISYLIKNFLEIKVIEQDADDDTRFFIETESSDAYRYFSKGLDKFFIKDWESAIDLFSLTLEIDPYLLWARIFLFTSYGNDGRYTIAKNLTDSLYRQIDEYDYDDQLYIKYFHSLYKKNAPLTSELIKKIIIENPHSRAMWYEAGRYYYNQLKQNDLAIEALEKSLEIDEKWGGEWKWIPLYTMLGSAYHENGQHEKEQEIYKLGFRISPDDPNIIFRQAVCALSRGTIDEANERIEKYRSIGKSEGMEKYWINYWIGRIYMEAEHFDKAMEIFNELIDENPNEPWSKYRLGSILIENDYNIDEGLNLVTQALEISPDNASFLFTKGLALYRKGRYEEAHEIIKKAWDLRFFYYHDHYKLLQEVEQALARQNSEQ